MKIKVTEDIEVRNTIREALKQNDFYCPCVVGSKGKKEFKCMCKDFLENVPAGEYCHCGLYYKDKEVN